MRRAAGPAIVAHKNDQRVLLQPALAQPHHHAPDDVVHLAYVGRVLVAVKGDKVVELGEPRLWPDIGPMHRGERQVKQERLLLAAIQKAERFLAELFHVVLRRLHHVGAAVDRHVAVVGCDAEGEVAVELRMLPVREPRHDDPVQVAVHAGQHVG